MVNSTLKFTMTVLGAVPPIQQFEPLKWVYRFIFIYATRNFFRAFFGNKIIGSRPKKTTTKSNELLLRIETNYSDYFNRRKNRYKITFGWTQFQNKLPKKVEKKPTSKRHSTPLNLVIKTTLHFIHGWNTHYCASHNVRCHTLLIKYIFFIFEWIFVFALDYEYEERS